jgi:hypothetical protein
VAVYTVTDNSPSNHKSGPSSVDFVTVDIDYVGTSYADIDSAQEVCRKALESYAGGTFISSIDLQDESDLFDQKNKLYRINHEYQLTVKRS